MKKQICVGQTQLGNLKTNKVAKVKRAPRAENNGSKKNRNKGHN